MTHLSASIQLHMASQPDVGGDDAAGMQDHPFAHDEICGRDYRRVHEGWESGADWQLLDQLSSCVAFTNGNDCDMVIRIELAQSAKRQPFNRRL